MEQIATFFICAALVAIAAYLGREAFRWLRVLRAIRTADQLRTRLQGFIDRLSLIEPLAEQHLVPEMGGSLIEEAAAIVNSTAGDIRHAESLLHEGSAGSVTDAELVLRKLIDESRWEETLEYLIQRIGAAIATVSSRTHVKRGTLRARRPTLLALDLAGVPVEQKQRR